MHHRVVVGHAWAAERNTTAGSCVGAVAGAAVAAEGVTADTWVVAMVAEDLDAAAAAVAGEEDEKAC